MNLGEVVRIQWRRLGSPGVERATISRVDRGYLLEGNIESQMREEQVISHYQIQTNTGWETSQVRVEVKAGEEKRSLLLSVDELQRWWDGDEEIGVLAGCQDIDLQISPITNTLAINRTAMPIGASRLVQAAWVRFPDLALQPIRQRYTRLDESIYLYENLESGYRAQLQVDTDGLVIVYGDVWERV